MIPSLPRQITLTRLATVLGASLALACTAASDRQVTELGLGGPDPDRVAARAGSPGELSPLRPLRPVERGAAALDSEARAALVPAASRVVHVPPPLELAGSVFEAAGTVPLPEVAPGEYPGIVNVYRLSDTIITGSEPHDAEALGQLAAWGVKTVLSVDGKMPDVAAATELGLRYVHVPIRYRGITEDQILKIAKTFRELEGPFYVHCFHGKHRGPAAAAIGRVALDGLERDRAIAEMRQWCSTASKYEGLYSSVALSDLPTVAETAAYDFDFSPAMSMDGVRDAMIALTRSWDDVKLVAKNGWKPSSEHPDIDALQSATHVSQLMNACGRDMKGTEEFEADYFEMLAESQGHLADVVEFLTDCRVEGTSEFLRNERLDAAFSAAKKSCLKCHSVYRN